MRPGAEGADLRREPDVIVKTARDRRQIVDFLPVHVSARAGPVGAIQILDGSSLHRDALGRCPVGGRWRRRLRGRRGRAQLQIYLRRCIRVVKTPDLVRVWPLAEAVTRKRAAGPDVRNIPTAAPGGSRPV